MYKGKIYKTNNMLGESLAKICGNDSSKISAEQRRIEAELKEFESHIWGDDAKNDSLDSVSVAPLTKKGKKSAVSRPAAAKKEKTAKPRRSSGSASSSSSSSARVTVRRQRH